MRALKSRIAYYIYSRFFSQDRRRQSWLKKTPAADLSPEMRNTADLLRQIAQEDPAIHVIWDVGANRGNWAILAHSFFPSANLFCFEPMQTHLVQLNAVRQRLGRIHIVPCAVGASAGSFSFFETDFSDCSSLRRPKPPARLTQALTVRREISIAVRRLDEIQHTENLPQPDLIKCDIQGAELDAVKGAFGILQGVRWLLLEAQFQPAYENASNPAELIWYMHQSGFDLVGIEKECEPGHPLVQADLLFCNRAFSQHSHKNI